MTHAQSKFDRDYRDRIMKAVFRVIVEASTDKTTNVAMIRNAEVADALLNLIAGFNATSEIAKEHTTLQRWCEAQAKKLYEGIKSVQQDAPNWIKTVHYDPTQRH